MKRITNSHFSERKFQNWLVARNAYAHMKQTDGYLPISEIAGRKEYETITRALLAVSNTHDPNHNKALAELRNSFGGASIDGVMSMADDLRLKMQSIAQNAMKAGTPVQNAEAVALNAYFGNPGYDQFAALNLLAEQLYEQLTFMQSFIEEGDSIQLTPDVANSATAISRFRLPRTEVSGASKTRQGDMNPYGAERLYSNNSAQISLISEFKNAHTESQDFFIDLNQQQTLLGYARSIAPALAGFILQNQLFAAIDEQIMQSAERIFVDGTGSASYDGETGDYGIISPNIMLALASAGAASPLLATGSDWGSNPTKLVQQISNYNYKPADRTQPIAASADPMNVYKDVVRLLNLIAQTNVATSGKVVLYVPTSLYAVLVNYLSTGTFNRTLGEALKIATGGTIQNIEVKASGLLNARTNSFGNAQYNHVVAVVHGAPMGRKGIVSPMTTASPIVSTGIVSEQRSSFAADYTFGGPMVIQRGQVFDLVFSVNA